MTGKGTRILFTIAPLLLFAGSFVHPEEPNDAALLQASIAHHQGAWLAAHLLLLAGITALIPVVLGLVSMTRVHAPRLSAAAAVGGVAGCSAGAAIFGGSIVGTYAGTGDPGAMTAFIDRVMHAPAYNGLFLGVILLIASMVGLAAVQAVVGRVSWPAAVLASAGFVLLVLPEPLVCIGWALSNVGLTLVARQLTSVDREAARLTRHPVSV